MNYLYDNVNDSCNGNMLSNENLQQITDDFNLNNVTRDNICNKIKDYFQVEDKTKCQNDTTLLGDNINDVHPLFFASIIENDKIFCGDIRNFVRLDKNPYTGVPFSDKLKRQFSNNLQKIKSIVRNTQEPENEAIGQSLSVLMADIFTQLHYPHSINLFMESNVEKLHIFLMQLLRYNIISNNDYVTLVAITDLYNLKYSTAMILKIALVTVDSYSISYAYNSVFTNDPTLQTRRLRAFGNDNYNDNDRDNTENDLDNNNSETEEELLESIRENQLGIFTDLINRTVIISLALLLEAIKFDRKEMIDIIITKLEITEGDDIEEIIKEIIYSKHYRLLMYLIDEKQYIQIDDISVYFENEIFNQIPPFVKEYIRNNNCILYSVDNDIQSDSYDRSPGSSSNHSFDT